MGPNFRPTVFLFVFAAFFYGAVAEGATIGPGASVPSSPQPIVSQGNTVAPTQIQLPVEIGRVLDSANQALAVTDKTANQTLAVAQTAIKTAETTMSEVRNAHQNLLAFLMAVLSIATVVFGLLGFKTLPDKVKEVAKAHAEAILQPKVDDLNLKLANLDSINDKQNTTIGNLNETNKQLQDEVLGLRDELLKIKEKSQVELQNISDHYSAVKSDHDSLTDSSRKNILSLTQGSYGMILGIRAEAEENFAQVNDQTKEVWCESAKWLERAEQVADGLDPSIQQWLLLTLAYSQKRAGHYMAALQSTEKAMDLMKPESIVFYNAACYSAICRDKEKMLKYLEAALTLDPSDSNRIIGDASKDIQGESDMAEYWDAPELQALVTRFKQSGG